MFVIESAYLTLSMFVPAVHMCARAGCNSACDVSQTIWPHLICFGAMHVWVLLAMCNDISLIAGCVVDAAMGVGQYQRDRAQSACKECAAGYYGPQTGQKRCVPCAKGTYAANSHSSVCSVCAAGKSQPELAQTSCVTCEPGTYSANAGHWNCTWADIGHFVGSANKDTQTACPTGECACTAVAFIGHTALCHANG